jgi:hypothetical protein
MPGVAIPTIDQTVSTPSFSVGANPFHAEPLESNVGPALAQAGDALHGIWKVQQDHANAVDIAQRMGNYQAQAGQAKVAALNSGQQGPDMIANYGKALTAIQDQTIAGTEDPANPNPPNYAVAHALQLLTADHLGQETGSFPSEAALKVREDLARKLPQNINLQVAGIAQDPASFQVLGPDGQTFNPANPDPTNQPHWLLTAKGLDRLALVQNLTHGATTGMPDQEQFWRNYAAQQLVRQHAMNIAMDPALAPHLDAFLKVPVNAAILTPEEQQQAQNAAVTTQRRPQQAMEVRNGNLDASLTQKYLDQAAAGNLDTAGITDDRAKRRISEDNFERVTGYAFVGQGNPGEIKDMSQQITGTNSDSQLNSLSGAISSQKDIYGRGSIPLQKQIENQRQQIKTVSGKAKTAGEDQINAYFRDINPVAASMYDMGRKDYGLSSLPQLHQQMLKDFNDHTREEQDLGKIHDALGSAMGAAYNKPDFSIVDKFVKKLPPRNPGESVGDYYRRAVKTFAPPTGATP